MPVTISVSEVRNALYLQDDPAHRCGEGAASNSVLGQWFHEGLGLLVTADSSKGFLATLSDVEADLEVWKQTLVSRAYAQFVGPQLTRQQAALREMAPQVLTFWSAMQAACHWIAELTWKIRTHKSQQRATPQVPWQTLADLFSTEETLSCELRQPGWTESVRLVGVADAIVRLAGSGGWCVIEFKLGRTSPAIDLGQACLYHLMLTSSEQLIYRGPSVTAMNDEQALALISFHPEKREQFFTTSQLLNAQQKLIDLIGKLAKVKPEGSAVLPQTARPADLLPPQIPVPREKSAPTSEHLKLGQGLIKILSDYGVGVSLGEPIDVGPTFLRFPIQLGRGTKVNAVKKLDEELQVQLQLKAAPFISSTEGRLVIDVQRPDRQKVYYDDIRPQLMDGPAHTSGSRIPIGVDLSGQLIFADLSKTDHSHLLVAGTTGSGKSEWLRLAIAGLIETNTPDTLRLLVIDPKRNAFHALRGSPYLWRPIIYPDEHSAADILAELSEEMDKRYRNCDGADNFSQMVAKSEGPLPRIVCVCDEYRDLISRDRKERKLIESQICRLGAKARAAGIHLILATQEPSRDTIKGPLDSNIPARVGLKMGKRLESTMLLNEGGAENLLGHGDLLFKDIGPPRRLQAPLMSDENRNKIFGKGVAR